MSSVAVPLFVILACNGMSPTSGPVIPGPASKLLPVNSQDSVSPNSAVLAKRKEGIDFYYNGDESKARAVFEEAIKLGDARSMTWMGLIERRPRDCKPKLEAALQWFKKAAEAGDSVGTRWLMLMYFAGEGVPKDLEKAKELLQQSIPLLQKDADAGDSQAMAYWADTLNSSREPGKYADQVYSWLVKSAGAGDLAGMYRLGTCHFEGIGTQKDEGKAIEWYRKAAGLGERQSQVMLGRLYLAGRGVPVDYAEALRWNQRAVEGGDIEAVIALAIQNLRGLGKSVDLGEAYRLYVLAAEAGEAEGALGAGNMNRRGIGRPVDNDEALRFYRIGVRLGDPACMYWVGEFLRSMKTDKESLSEAFGLLFRATELKHGPAFSSLGLMYEHGLYVDQNFERAFSWYKAGADLSDPDSVNLLGVLFKEGRGVGESAEDAVRCFEKAAKLGHLKGMINYANCLYHGFGIETNREEAILWLKRAAERGSAEARDLLEKVGGVG